MTIIALLVLATLIAVWLNDKLPGGNLPDSFFENNDQSTNDKTSGH
jgi:hypothetical protein